MMNLRSRKTLAIVTALFLVFSFAAALFHSHAEGHHDHECLICRLISYLGVILGLGALLAGVTRPQNFYPRFSPRKPVFLTLPVVSGRAPPFLK